MAVFSYQARDNAGNTVEGTLEAANRAEAARQIRRDGNFVVRVDAGVSVKSKSSSAGSTRRSGREKYKPDDLIYFTNQMAVMIETGVSLAEALEACSHEGNSPRFARALDGVIAHVQAGRELSGAMSEYPTVFPTIYVSLIKASEASGQLGPIMKRLATHLEGQRELIKRVKGAITYPAVMVIFAIGTTVFLVTYVLPKFAGIYAGREDSLPTLTRVLLGASDMFASYWMYGTGALLATAGAGFYYFRKPEGRVVLDRILLRLPLIGPLFHKTYLARSMRTLGTMIQSGVSMLESVQLTKNVCKSLAYKQMWDDVNQRVEAGRQISDALATNQNIPRSVLKMLDAGERSGKLGDVMNRVAGFCEEELNASLKQMTSMIEPAIVTFLGIVVGGLVLAMLLPIFTISKAIH